MIQTGSQRDQTPTGEWAGSRIAGAAIVSAFAEGHVDEGEVKLLPGWVSSRVIELGALRVSVVTLPSGRTPGVDTLLWRPSPRTYHLTLPLTGQVHLRQAGGEVVVGRGGFALHDTSRPYEIRAARGEGPIVVLGVHVPKSLVPLPSPSVDALHARPLTGGGGIGALLAGFLNRLASDTRPYRQTDAERLGAALLHLLTALLGAEADTAAHTAPDSPQRALARRIQDHIERQLGDEDLTPRRIAAHHHISTSHLHRLFQEQGATVCSWIRERRLERCCRDLADPAMSATPIYAICSRWGFAHPPDFSRAFRSAYGMTPKEYRLRARSSHTGSPVKEMATLR